MKITIILTTTLALAFCGCARFSTKQQDIRYNEQGTKATKVVTKASAWTFGDSKSQLANFKAKQSESSQSADVGSLDQQASATNIVNALELMVDLAKSVK